MPAPVWMTFKQALELGGCVRKGERGSLVVYASTFTRTETDGESGEEAERDIPFLKGYTVFNVEQIDGLPAHFRAPAAAARPTRAAHRARRGVLCGDRGRPSGMAAIRPITAVASDFVQMPPLRDLPGRGKLLRDLGARTDALDPAPVAA